MKIRDYARIVVEGMDGSGKSTLVKSLMTYLGDQGHYVPGYNRLEGERPRLDLWWMQELALNPVGKIVVHDRFFYPELIYGPLLRGKVAVEAGTVNYVRGFLRARALLIYCRPPVEIIVKGSKVRPQMKGVHERFNELLRSYDQLMIDEANAMDWRFIKYDWTEENSLMKLLSRVAGYIYQ